MRNVLEAKIHSQETIDLLSLMRLREFDVRTIVLNAIFFNFSFNLFVNPEVLERIIITTKRDRDALIHTITFLDIFLISMLGKIEEDLTGEGIGYKEVSLTSSGAIVTFSENIFNATERFHAQELPFRLNSTFF